MARKRVAIDPEIEKVIEISDLQRLAKYLDEITDVARQCQGNCSQPRQIWLGGNLAQRTSELRVFVRELMDWA